MTCEQTRFRLDYDPRLVEEAVHLRIRGDRNERGFHGGRERIYLLPDAEEREREFQRFHASWFVRLDLGRTIREAWDELPILAGRRCCVFAARSASEEGADLHQWRATRSDESEGGGTVVIRMTATRFLAPLSLQLWLRRELMHVADMCDPAYGYSPVWPASQRDPAALNIQRERYRVLWDTWIDGRLFRRGALPREIRELRLAEFTAAFPVSGPDAARRFEEIFDAEAQTHAALLEMALNPGAQAGGETAGPARSLPCPLCRFPTFELEPGGIAIGADVMSLIRADFPAWQPEHGLCRQCVDLYHAREMSRSEAELLPGIR
jgi:hypothetical protein